MQASPGEDPALMSYLRATADPRIDGRDIWQAYAYRQTTGFGASFNTAVTRGGSEGRSRANDSQAGVIPAACSRARFGR
jgi:hypothetical protein